MVALAGVKMEIYSPRLLIKKITNYGALGLTMTHIRPIDLNA